MKLDISKVRIDIFHYFPLLLLLSSLLLFVVVVELSGIVIRVLWYISL